MKLIYKSTYLICSSVGQIISPCFIFVNYFLTFNVKYITININVENAGEISVEVAPDNIEESSSEEETPQEDNEEASSDDDSNSNDKDEDEDDEDNK